MSASSSRAATARRPAEETAILKIVGTLSGGSFKASANVRLGMFRRSVLTGPDETRERGRSGEGIEG